MAHREKIQARAALRAAFYLPSNFLSERLIFWKMIPLDTTPEAARIQLEVFRRMGPKGRLQAGIALSRTCRELLREGVRRRHPEYDERQIRLAVIRLMLPEDLFRAAYPEARDILP